MVGHYLFLLVVVVTVNYLLMRIWVDCLYRPSSPPSVYPVMIGIFTLATIFFSFRGWNDGWPFMWAGWTAMWIWLWWKRRPPRKKRWVQKTLGKVIDLGHRLKVVPT